MKSEWRRTTVGNEATLQGGFDITRKEQRSGLVPVISSSGITSYHDTPAVKGPGVVIGRKGSLGTVFYVEENYWPHDTTLWVKDFHGNYPKFVYYFFKSLDVMHLDVGSANPTLNRNHVHPIQILWPPLEEQKAIAHIVGTLDDKIELNQQMNRNLEAIAQAIFKSWFVDFDPVRAKMEGRQPADMDAATAALFPDSFEDSQLGEIPKGWKIGTLDDITEFVLGGDWGKDNPTEQDSEAAYCIRGADIPDLQNAGLGKMPIRYLKPSSIKKRSLLTGDIVIEISGGSPTQSTGRPVLITEELLGRLSHSLVCSNFCRMVRLKENIPPIFIYLWLRWLYTSDAFLQYENGTTGIKNFAYTIFSQRHEVIIPPLDLLKHFDLVVSKFFKKRQASGAESYTLATIRDPLLPKLMSGEIRVKEAEKILEDVA